MATTAAKSASSAPRQTGTLPSICAAYRREALRVSSPAEWPAVRAALLTVVSNCRSIGWDEVANHTAREIVRLDGELRAVKGRAKK